MTEYIEHLYLEFMSFFKFPDYTHTSSGADPALLR